MGKTAETTNSLVDLKISPPSANAELALTGATGFIGTALLSHLTAAGWRVRALYRPRKGRVLPKIPGVEWFAGNLNDDAVINTLVKDVHAVIHCAGAVRGASRADFDRVNEEGALRLSMAAAQQTNMPRFLLISSLAARAPELSHYAGSKWRGECAIKTVSEDLRWTVLRPPAVFGPGDRELLPLFRSMAKGFAPLPAGAKGRFSMIYVDDLAAAVVHWLAADAGYGQTMELDDGFAGGYDWDTVLDIGGRVLRNGASVRRIPIPVSVLKFAAFTNLGASRL
ncbi:MAG TPA: NAD-dependent epimerase/dehydratase family protein, partial [Gammaproteobacteria bacterium]|nr:NAD-dependent epimerase/dehydratase family protein [Gammaproteobacteria bacterium]